MNKRRRKKLRKGEFQELGFLVDIHLSPQLTESELDDWLDSFIDAVETIGLSVGGGGQYQHQYAVSSGMERGTVAIAQQEELAKWLAECPSVITFQKSDLFDMWYPPGWTDTWPS